LHELLRAGKSVRDQYRGSAATGCRLIDGQWSAVQGGVRDVHACGSAAQLDERRADRESREAGEQKSSVHAPSNRVALCNAMLRPGLS
jgi:hypothetical protein